MKKLSISGLIVLFFISFSVIASAQNTADYIAYVNTPSTHIEKIEKKFDSNYKTIEANYLKGLKSKNMGVQASSAYFLGEMKSEKALFPLMKMFSNPKTGEERLLAAWSLLKIGDSRGVYLVKNAIEDGTRSGANCMLTWLYRDYRLKTTGGIQ